MEAIINENGVFVKTRVKMPLCKGCGFYGIKDECDKNICISYIDNIPSFYVWKRTATR